MAYISILKNASLWKFIAPSSTSGAIYLRVPTLKDNKAQKLVHQESNKTTITTLPSAVVIMLETRTVFWSKIRKQPWLSSLRTEPWKFLVFLYPNVGKRN